MNEILMTLEPNRVWKHFQTLCCIPRPSYHEETIREWLIEWANGLGLQSYVDPVGNLLIKKGATPGMEDRVTVVLQGHLDMVAQKDSNIEHDFTKDPIVTRVVDGWVQAMGTTLGADNGIGVAAAMAVLESTDLQHGPIEALFTIEEESSLRGALQLESGILQGKVLLNLDSEDRGDVYIGCAGGIDINVTKTMASLPVGNESTGIKMSITGLRGGHSGLDIHKGRASANVLLIRLLNLLKESYSFGLSDFSGGTLRNAIAREAEAAISIRQGEKQKVRMLIEQLFDDIKLEYQSVDPSITLEISDWKVGSVLSEDDQNTLLNALYCAPHGVHRMSVELPGVTETSCNLGVIHLLDAADGNKKFDACLLVRSLMDSAVKHLALSAKAAFQLMGAKVLQENAYPGWKPDPSSGLLSHFLSTHKDIMGYEANVKVIHAGLECGIIGAKYPGMEMVSFGPNIRGAHSPAERMEIDSVEDFWQLLQSLLSSMPKAKDGFKQ